MSQRELETHQQVGHDLWTPQDVSVGGLVVLGHNVETARKVIMHKFHFKDKQTGRETMVPVLADLDTSQAQIEDMAAQAFENWITEVRSGERKRAPTPEEKKDIGKALDDFRKHLIKRKQSTSGRIYF